VIPLPKHLSNEIARFAPEGGDPPLPITAARVETTSRDPKDTAHLVHEVLVATARLLGRQLARAWFRAEV
jgi:hypothetical protein